MRKKYITLNNDKLLNSESWLWFNSNKQKEEERNTIYIQILKIDQLDGDILTIMNNLKIWIDDFSNGFTKLIVEKVSIHQGNGEFLNSFYLVGERLESCEEKNLRLFNLKKEKDILLNKKKDEEKLKEHNQFLKLKARFDKNE